jgi:LmbE family N-acetylglucosaminyl deacetylase
MHRIRERCGGGLPGRLDVKIAVVSPHRDDAALSLGLSIGAWIEAGHSVTVVNCFTRSEYAPFSDADSLHANDRLHYVTALRLREDVAWQKQYPGRLTLHDLNLKDAPLRLHCGLDEVCGRAVNPVDKAFVKIPKALEGLRADALVLPLALGAHVDHVTARDAAMQFADARGDVASGSAADAKSAVADDGAAIACAFYEDLPYAARLGAVDQIEPLAAGLGMQLAPVFGGQLGSAGEPWDVAAAVKRKRRLALCYDSQIDDETIDAVASFCERYDGRERLWANAAWCASNLGEAEPEASAREGERR